MPAVALSIKQPWATLVVFGIKTIEIRRWSRKPVGPFYVHTGQEVDERPEGWKLITPVMLTCAEQRGGVVGVAEMVGCRVYRSQETFDRDAALHHNASDWFQPPVLYGLEFTAARPIPFVSAKGNLYFFPVDLPPAEAVPPTT